MTIASCGNVDFGGNIDIKALAQNSVTKEIRFSMQKGSTMTMREYKTSFDIKCASILW